MRRKKRNQQHTVFPSGTHPSTNRARHSLTLVIEREPVVPTWDGRWR